LGLNLGLCLATVNTDMQFDRVSDD
jgi:hypothetical protein